MKFRFPWWSIYESLLWEVGESVTIHLSVSQVLKIAVWPIPFPLPLTCPRIVGFSVCPGFLLVITAEWQLPSSLRMELLTRILSKEANLMFLYSTGHLCCIPSLFFFLAHVASSPCFQDLSFGSLIMHFSGIFSWFLWRLALLSVPWNCWLTAFLLTCGFCETFLASASFFKHVLCLMCT